MVRRSRPARVRRSMLSRLGWSTRERHELQWLVAGLGACVLLFLFVRLAGEVTDGDTQSFDTRILQSLGDPADPSKPIGPIWMEGALQDLTALGASTVLSLMVLAIVGYLVGVSRVYLGVHYPTDVIGGWIVGFMWASICWLVAGRLEYRAGLAAERKKAKE